MVKERVGRLLVVDIFLQLVKTKVDTLRFLKVVLIMSDRFFFSFLFLFLSFPLFWKRILSELSFVTVYRIYNYLAASLLRFVGYALEYLPAEVLVVHLHFPFTFFLSMIPPWTLCKIFSTLDCLRKCLDALENVNLQDHSWNRLLPGNGQRHLWLDSF